MNTVSVMDVDNLAIIRNSVDEFLRYAAARYAGQAGRLLDVAPQEHPGARPFFPSHVSVETLDIDPRAGATYTADLCDCEAAVAGSTFDYVVCTEVLEHTRQPFKAAESLFRVLKPGGLCFATTPFNFRIHGPSPDCWRFTESGLRELFKPFHVVELTAVDMPDRFLMPIHYRVVAQRPVC
jgi:SAM-dependent methyltransferase